MEGKVRGVGGREGRTDAESADEDADDVCVADFLDDGVAAHEELVRTSGLEPGGADLWVVRVYLTYGI